MKIKELEKEHKKSKYKCKKFGACYCTGCILEWTGTVDENSQKT